MDFLGEVQKTVDAFRNIPGLRQKVIRIIGNLDTDGLSATSIMVRAFQREQLRFAVSIVKQIDDAVLRMVASEQYEIIFFLDLGAGTLSMINDRLPKQWVFVLDHHYPEKVTCHEKFAHINPHNHGLSGTKDLSAAGVTYFFARALSERNKDMSLLALLGAVGDVQDSNGFIGLNGAILQDALATGKIQIEEGVRIYGIATKPLHKALEYSTNPYIPGVSGSEEGAIKFLKGLGINHRQGLSYRRYADLSKDEAKSFVSAVMMSKVNPEEAKPESVYGDVYLVVGEDEDLPTRELHEFSTLLNCCGRLGRPSFGIGTCLGDATLKEKAVHLLHEYRNEILRALQWFYRSRGSEAVLELQDVTIINAQDHVSDTLIGTLTSLISKSIVYREGTVVIGMARTMGEETKISLRVSGFGEAKVNLRTLAQDVVVNIGGSGGGHSLAAGAVIPRAREEDFIAAIKTFFAQLAIAAT